MLTSADVVIFTVTPFVNVTGAQYTGINTDEVLQSTGVAGVTFMEDAVAVAEPSSVFKVTVPAIFSPPLAVTSKDLTS